MSATAEKEEEVCGRDWADIIRLIAKGSNNPVVLNIPTRDGDLVDPIAALSSEEGMKELLSAHTKQNPQQQRTSYGVIKETHTH